MSDMTKKAKILWVDLEMTGLDPIDDRIMEVAAIATDWDFTEIAVYDAVVRVDPQLVEQRMNIGKAFWDANPESRDALVKQNVELGRSPGQIEDELLAFLDEHFEDGKPVLLAGNSIHQDRKFIANEWERLDGRLHYRMLDVSAWKVVFEGKFKKKFAKPEEHRALGDIRGSIMELKYYLGKVRV
jgi:oligoribonuclease